MFVGYSFLLWILSPYLQKFDNLMELENEFLWTEFVSVTASKHYIDID